MGSVSNTPIRTQDYLTHYALVGESPPQHLCTSSSLCLRVPLNGPRLFKPAHLSALGTFQDGGLKHNNPINLALWENRYIWPSANVDMVLSLGTGTTKASASPSAPNFRHVFLDGFIPRLYRSFISSLDGQSAWQDLQNRLDNESRKDYFRLNVILTEKQFTIDDVNCMAELRDCVHTKSDFKHNCTEIVHAILLSSLFFELSHMPLFVDGVYHCYGMIRCRLDGICMLEALGRLQQSHWAVVTETEILGYLEPERHVCKLCRCYQMPVRVTTRHPADTTTIYVQSITKARRKISGFPQTMEWFVLQQGLEADFGTPHHSRIGHPKCRACGPTSKRRGRKRKSSETDDNSIDPKKKSARY